MKKIVVSILTLILATSGVSIAGNKDRSGQAGAGQLQINPWARSSGMAGANSSFSTGLESTYGNIAGLAFTPKTEIMFARTSWLTGSSVSVNAFGLSQKVGETGVIGINVNSMGFGDIDITTEELPEGGIGTFSPKLNTFGLAYSKAFSNSIYGGIGLKVISESISNARATGAAFDMGVRYVTGENDNIKFGIALKNIGPKMKMQGDGFSYTTVIDEEEFTVEWRTEGYELPSLLNIGASYDYYVNASVDSVSNRLKADHRITPAFTFTANSFGKDQLRFGAEYGFKNLIMIRAGYLHESGVGNIETRTTFNTGFTGGATVQIPLNDAGSTIDLDYAYRSTNPMSGHHSIGVRVNL